MSMPSMMPFIAFGLTVDLLIVGLCGVVLSGKWKLLHRPMKCLWISAFLWPLLASLMLAVSHGLRFGVVSAIDFALVFALDLYICPFFYPPLGIAWWILLGFLAVLTSRFFPDKKQNTESGKP